MNKEKKERESMKTHFQGFNGQAACTDGVTSASQNRRQMTADVNVVTCKKCQQDYQFLRAKPLPPPEQNPIAENYDLHDYPCRTKAGF